MAEKNNQDQMDRLMVALRERAKELNCLYRIEDLLRDTDRSHEEVINGIIAVIPDGWQYPEVCKAKIEFGGDEYKLTDFNEETEWVQHADIKVHDVVEGKISVYYTKETPGEAVGPFLQEEQQLVETIAERLGHFILFKRLRRLQERWDSAQETIHLKHSSEWKVAIELLKRTDVDLFSRITRQMLNYLCWSGIEEAEYLLQQISLDRKSITESIADGGNQPLRKRHLEHFVQLSDKVFDVADRRLPDDEILFCIEKWIMQDKAAFLIRSAVSLDSSLGDIADALRRYRHFSPSEVELSVSSIQGLRVALIRRFISDQLHYIQIVKDYVTIEAFHKLIPRLIIPPNSHGQLGGKSAGLFMASNVLSTLANEYDEFKDITVPKTWYITSDGLLSFLYLNNLEEITEQKYKEIGQVRQEYPHIVQLFKSSIFSTEIILGVSMALDDFGDVPLIVRSSSLLEDRLGSAFSGKYVSLFLANKGTKQERLSALLDAVAEVYASTFSPDPIEYRAERGLLDFHEEMGIMIQEVVGTQVGKYFVPTFAGVMFSNNEFRWSPRIKREDGLIRLVPGLGTRAVDRLSDDYPVLIAPGQPGLRVNQTVDEVIHYSPQKMDLINLETNRFETVDIREFLEECGNEWPGVENLVSIVQDNHLKVKSLFNLDFEKDDMAITFEGLMKKTDFITKTQKMLSVLQERLGVPVDVEFAVNGKDFYLLQCRPQSYSKDARPMLIPKDIPETAILFTANRYISNGYVPDITHLVYVDPIEYSELQQHKQLIDVGKAIGKLNRLLPKRQFILMGPGRWGSRGDIKLGVNVTYADISNTAMLIEIARQKGNYVPDLSFGTHFFQDLVESSIRYLPLYPDDKSIVFNETFFRNSKNILEEILPEYSHLDKVIKVIDIPGLKNGKIVKVYMNAELDEAVGIITQPTGDEEKAAESYEEETPDYSEDHWRWRIRMAEQIALKIDADKYGVDAMYVFGSTKNGTAGPGSDLDLLVHFSGSEKQRCELENWFDGWSQCLGEINFLRTGYKTDSLLDVHLITDEDIDKRNSWAVKIGAVTDAAKELPMSKGE